MSGARFHTLDALRGIAAIAVMLFHAKALAPLPLPSGFLAADLFFILSGFVLANAYDDRLRAGLGFRPFIRARLERIYPVFWLGAVTGLLLWGGSPLIMLMVPTPSPTGLLYEANAPMWSLLFELIANAGWALIAARLTTPRLIAVLLGLGGLLLAAMLREGSVGMGPFWPTALPGLIRTCFSFTVGIALLRLFRWRGSPQLPNPAGWLLLPVLLLLLAYDPVSRFWFDLFMIGFALPLIVWLGACHEVNGQTLATRLGGLSFPLYCLHLPFIAFVLGAKAALAVVCAAMIVLALLVDRYFDRPIQDWLKARKQSKREAACPKREALI